MITVKKARAPKKFKVIVDGKEIEFGASGYSDFTKHKDEDRKELYLKRHQKRENWDKSGIKTAGFWSRWALWNKDTLDKSLKDVGRRFNVKIKNET